MTLLPILRNRAQALLLGAMLVASTSVGATLHSAQPGTDSCAIAWSPVPVDAALVEADRQRLAFSVDDEPCTCRFPFPKRERLRDLIDKYGPSAVEWSLFPHLAERSDSSRRHGDRQ